MKPGSGDRRPALLAIVVGSFAAAGCDGAVTAPPLGDTEAVLLGAPGANPDISGPWVVWREISPERVIIAFNLETGEERRISQASDRVDFPAIDGTTVVWIDFGNDRVAVGDVFGTPETLIGSVGLPDVSGRHVVRRGPGVRDVWLYDRETGRDTLLWEGIVGNEPRVDGGRVVWGGHVDDGGGFASCIFLHDVAANSTQIISPPEGSHGEPDISGDWVVWAGRLPIAGEGDLSRSEVLLFNLVTRELRRITDDQVTQQAAVIDGDIIVWQDTRNHPVPAGERVSRVDLFMYDIATGEEKRLTGSGSIPRPFVRPAISSRRVVWLESIENPDVPFFSIMMLELPR